MIDGDEVDSVWHHISPFHVLFQVNPRRIRIYDPGITICLPGRHTWSKWKCRLPSPKWREMSREDRPVAKLMTAPCCWCDVACLSNYNNSDPRSFADPFTSDLIWTKGVIKPQFAQLETKYRGLGYWSDLAQADPTGPALPSADVTSGH